MKKLPVVVSLTFLLTFLGLFIYSYKSSGKFRKSIASALFAALVIVLWPVQSTAKDVHGVSSVKRTSVPYYDKSGACKATVFVTAPSEDSSEIIIAFNESTRDLITGDKQRKLIFGRFEKQNYLGGKKWMLKWNN